MTRLFNLFIVFNSLFLIVSEAKNPHLSSHTFAPVAKVDLDGFHPRPSYLTKQPLARWRVRVNLDCPLSLASHLCK